MKKLIGLTLLCAALGSAGVRIPGAVKAATYPVLHPMKTVKGTAKVISRILW